LDPLAYKRLVSHRRSKLFHHPGDSRPFLEAEEFVRKIMKDKRVPHPPVAIEVLLKEMAGEGGPKVPSTEFNCPYAPSSGLELNRV
jgi:hypothetical protein